MVHLGGVTGYRVAAYDTPLWVSPNRAPGRYSAPGSPPTQYVCGHPAGPWAELLRLHDERDPAAAATLRIRLWALRIAEPVLEVTFDNAAAFGIEPGDLVDDDWSACQSLATRVYRDTSLPDILCVPSAALPGTVNYVLFGARLTVPFDASPIDPEDVPTAHAAEDARPLEVLTSLVCFPKTAHAGYLAWQNGGELPPLTVPVPR